MLTNRFTLLALPLTAASLLLASCGGDGGTATAGDSREDLREAALEYAQCMRKHGVDMPDPQFKGGGMAMQLAAGRPPSFTEDELRGMRAASGMPEAGFELETRRFPEIRAADGRYEMPHMWVYSLLATPGVLGARLLGAAP